MVAINLIPVNPSPAPAVPRRCRACGETKPESEFYRVRSKGYDTPRATCKVCVRKRMKAYVQYGLDEAAYEALLQAAEAWWNGLAETGLVVDEDPFGRMFDGPAE